MRFRDSQALPADPAPTLPHHLPHPQNAPLAAPIRLSTSPAIPPSGPTSLPRYTTATALSISFSPTQRDPGPTPAAIHLVLSGFSSSPTLLPTAPTASTTSWA